MHKRQPPASPDQGTCKTGEQGPAIELLGGKGHSLATALVSRSSRVLKVPTRIISARHSFPLGYRALSVRPQRPPQAEPAPTCGEGPAGGLLETGGATRATQSCAQGRTEKRCPGHRAGREALRVACASAWLAAAATLTSQEAFAARPALPPTRVWSLRRGARGLEPPPLHSQLRVRRGPEMSPHPTIPGHSPWSRAAAAPTAAAAAAAAGRAWRELRPGCRPSQPALGGGAGGRRTGRGRREDSAAAAGLQRRKS